MVVSLPPCLDRVPALARYNFDLLSRNQVRALEFDDRLFHYERPDVVAEAVSLEVTLKGG